MIATTTVLEAAADRGQVPAAVTGEQLVSIPSLEFTERAAIIVPPPRMGYAGPLLILGRPVL